MLTMNELKPLLDHRSAVVSDQGDEVGSLGEVYLAEATDQPAWVTVHTGLSGTRDSFVPLRGARVEDGRLVVAYPYDLIKQAPSIDSDGHLGSEEESALHAHYHLMGRKGSDRPDAPVKGERDDDGEPWMTRSEERLRVGTERYEAGLVRMRKYIVTEEARATVSLGKEELHIEVEPITSTTPDPEGDVPFQEQSVEVVLREEFAVVSKEAVPVERVRMNTVTMTGRATVREEVRKERISISFEGDQPPGALGGKARRPTAGTSPASRSRTTGEDSSAIVRNSPNALVKGKKKRR